MRSILFILLFLSTATAQQLPVPHGPFAPKQYVCYRTASPLVMDGRLKEPAWSSAPWTDDFVDIEGDAKPMPRFRTRAKMLWDEKYLYIAAELQEPDVWGTLTHRDDIIFLDNDFEVFIDPDGDTRDYVEFEMNALNTVWDLLLEMPYRDIEKANKHQWDIPGLKSGVSVRGSINRPGGRDSGWTVEIAFPWSGFKEVTDLPCPPKENDQWRINFSRVEWKTEIVNGKYRKVTDPNTQRPLPEDNWVWSPQGVVNMHYPEMWGFLQFSSVEAGKGTVPFQPNTDEQAKWQLRRLYYAQRNHRDSAGTYAASLSELGLVLDPVPGFASAPTIERTSGMFVASLRATDGSRTLHIRHDGYVWTTRTKQ